MGDRSKALIAVQSAGLLNTKLTLSEVMEAASRLDLADGMSPGEENGWWAVVGPGYVVAGGAVDLEAISKSIQR
jgi:hypothetical protein